MYDCAKLWSVGCLWYFPIRNDKAVAEKPFIRGTVTDGHNWIFLVLNMNANGVGALCVVLATDSSHGCSSSW